MSSDANIIVGKPRMIYEDLKGKKVAEQTPLGRNGTAEDVAKAILFLASEAASFITGEYIAVNGGLYMRA
jgi:NAD(P)-dependent dehydrogenase (short-subunit alcohol dehydrogenase family)